MSQIITQADLGDYTTIDNDSLAAQIVDGVNAYIGNVTGRSWGESATISDERHALRQSIWLRHTDIISVESIRYYYLGSLQRTLSSSEYWWSPIGQLRLTWLTAYGRGAASELFISYTHGNTVVPDDLKHAGLVIANGMYTAAKNGEQDAQQIEVGGYKVRYQQSVGTSGQSQSSNARYAFGVIDSYKLRHG